MKKRDIPLAKPSIEEQPILELKEIPGHLRYMLLGEKKHFANNYCSRSSRNTKKDPCIDI